MQHRAETALNSAPHEKYWFCTRQRKGGSGHEGQDTYEKKPSAKEKKTYRGGEKDLDRDGVQASYLGEEARHAEAE